MSNRFSIIGRPIAMVVALGLVLLSVPVMAGAQTTSASENEAQKQLSNLTASLANGSVGSGSRMPDLRSAVIFSDSRGSRIGALYFGRYFGRYVGQFGGAEGSIGNTPVKFNGGLAKGDVELRSTGRRGRPSPRGRL